MTSVNGLIQIHSLPKHLRARCEWEIARILGRPVSVRWHRQPSIPSSLCGVVEWVGEAGCAAQVASALFGWRDLRFDMYESASPGNDGVRFSYTPRLGLFRAPVDASGATVVTEDRLRLAIESAGSDVTAIRESINDVLGTAWDLELEALRAEHLDITVAS